MARRVAAGGQMPTASPGGLAVLALAAGAHSLAGARRERAAGLSALTAGLLPVAGWCL